MKTKTYRKLNIKKSIAYFIKSSFYDTEYLLCAELSNRCSVYRKVFQLILNIL